jgi:hypothetical protein
MVVEVDFSATQILDIRVITHGESMYGAMYYFRAYPMVPDQIIMQQSTNYLRVIGNAGAMRAAGQDLFVGGTATQASIVNAVEDAIRQAGVDPTSLVAHPLPSRPLPGDRFVPGSHTVYVPAETYAFLEDGRFVRGDTFANWSLAPAANNAQERPWRNPEQAAFFAEVAPVTGGLRAQRVLYNAPNLAGRNNNAAHAPILHNSTRAGGTAAAPLTMNAGAMNNIGREMGFDASATNPFYNGGAAVGIWVTVNFARNYFQLMEHASGDGLGTAGSGGGNRPFSGESLAHDRMHTAYGAAGLAAVGFNGSSSSQALGGYFWIQTAHRTINDRQSTLHVDLDLYSGATQSALGVRLGVERAMLAAGATQAEINNFAPRAFGDGPFYREHHAGTYGANGLRLIPGRYYVALDGFPGLRLVVGQCRSIVRYVALVNEAGTHMSHAVGTAHHEAADFVSILPAGFVLTDWANQDHRDNPGSPANEQWGTSFRGRLLFAFAETYANGGRTAATFATVEGMPGQEALSNAIVAALQSVVSTYNYNNINQAGRLGQEVVPSPFR